MDRIDVIYEMKDDNLNLPKYIEFSSLKQKEKSEIIEKLSFNEKTYMRKWINEIDKKIYIKEKQIVMEKSTLVMSCFLLS